MAIRRPPGDQQLVQIVDAALADATRRSGDWLKCKPGCTQCCVGVFPISQLDAARLRYGLERLEADDPKRAQRVRKRLKQASALLVDDFPGDRETKVLDESEEAQARFEDYANDVTCPVLDPKSGRCDLYEWRPITCRAFGPPIRTEEGLGICELCFNGASAEEIARCEMKVDPDGVESKLLDALEMRTGRSGRTIVAFAFD